MKKLLVIASLIALSACSSKPKETETDMAATQTEAQAAVTETKAQQNVAAIDAGMDAAGDFPHVEGTERSGATCKNGGTERMVSVIDTREGPCGVVYTKNSSKKTVAYAKHEMNFCDKVYDNIIGNLSNGGFDCGGAQAASKQAEPAAEEAEETTAE